MRLLSSDPEELRTEHLFDLASMCSVPPPMVDALRYLDFVNLVLCIEATHEAEKKALKEARDANGNS